MDRRAFLATVTIVVGAAKAAPVPKESVPSLTIPPTWWSDEHEAILRRFESDGFVNLGTFRNTKIEHVWVRSSYGGVMSVPFHDTIAGLFVAEGYLQDAASIVTDYKLKEDA